MLGGCLKNSSLASALTQNTVCRNGDSLLGTGTGTLGTELPGLVGRAGAWGFCLTPVLVGGEQCWGVSEKESLTYLQRETENIEAEEVQTPKSIMKSEDRSVLIGN